MTIDEVLAFEEMQIFDRKSIKIDAKTLAITLVAFANADGGTVAIGISDKMKRIEGIDFDTPKINELLRVPFDYCNPTISVMLEKVECIDYKGRKNHVLLMQVDASPQVHANQADEAYYRVGDKSKLLKFEERLQLSYDKGERHFEDKPVPDAGMEDIDLALVEDYTKKIGYNKSPIEYLKQNKGFVKEENGQIQISSAAILLFGKNPQDFFPRARVRFIRYDGTEEKVGTEMNVIKDVIFEGNILKIIQDSINFLKTQTRERTYLGDDGRFVNEEEYPKFVQQEIIVNAVTHRSYNIMGTDIQIKMFDDHMSVESPGRLPGMVKVDNIRYTHFSRNPKIAEYLKAYEYVKEYGEGVARMCKELEEVGLHEPQYFVNAFMLRTVVYNNFSNLRNDKNKISIKGKNEYLRKKTEKDKKDSACHSENRQFKGREIAIDKIVQCLNKKVAAFEKKRSQFNKNISESSRLDLNKIKSLLDKENYHEITKNNIIKVCKNIDVDTVFSVKDIAKILGLSEQGARKILDKMKTLGILIKVDVKGKRQYRLKDEDEE